MKTSRNDVMGVLDVQIRSDSTALTAAAPGILRAVQDDYAVWIRVAGCPGSAVAFRDETTGAVHLQKTNLFDAPNWMGRLERLLTKGTTHG